MVHTNYGKSSSLFCTITIWNNLPTSLKCKVSLISFKNSLKEYLLNSWSIFFVLLYAVLFVFGFQAFLFSFCFVYCLFLRFKQLLVLFFFICNHHRGSRCSRVLWDPRLHILLTVTSFYVMIVNWLIDWLIWSQNAYQMLNLCPSHLYILSWSQRKE